MKIKDRIEVASRYFQKNGYKVEHPSIRGIDLVVYPPNIPSIAVLVACMETKRSFPMQPFGGSKTRIARFESLVKGADVWCAQQGWKGKVRYDSVTINEHGMLDHIENAGYVHGFKTVGHTVPGSLTITH